MRTLILTAGVLLGTCTGAAQAAPELLASYYAEVENGFAESHDRVEFSLMWDRGGPPNWVFFGRGEGPFWLEGETGTYTYTPDNTINFHEFMALLTDDVSDQLTFWSLFPDGDGQGLHRWESEVFGTDTDLVGNYIDHVCYHVHDVSFWEDGMYWCSTAVTWEFWTPEPASLSLLMLGVALVIPRRSPRSR